MKNRHLPPFLCLCWCLRVIGTKSPDVAGTKAPLKLLGGGPETNSKI